MCTLVIHLLNPKEQKRGSNYVIVQCSFMRYNKQRLKKKIVYINIVTTAKVIIQFSKICYAHKEAHWHPKNNIGQEGQRPKIQSIAYGIILYNERI